MPAQPFSRFFHHSAFAWRGENGVKNLKGARLFPKTFPTTELEMLTFCEKCLNQKQNCFYNSTIKGKKTRQWKI